VLFISFVDLFLEALVGLGILKICFYVIDAFGKPIPEFLIDRRSRIFGNLVRQHFAERFGGVIVGCETNDGELLGEQPVASQIAQRGN